MIARALTRDEVAACLVDAQAEILGLGVRRLALFGSVQRDTARADSDVDVLVEFQPGQKTYDHFVALGDLLERVLSRPVELVTAESLSPFLKPHILAEAKDVVRAA
ncbi:MAG: nucleotidyltransferase family protein [Gemmatimonadaceae bacterium]